jgi:hypothetical protein
MQRILYLVVCLVWSAKLQAQGWQPPTLPEAPKPSVFTPVLPGNTMQLQPAQAPRPDPLAGFEADRRRVEADQRRQAQERRQIQDDVNEAFGPKPGHGYAAATQPGDPRAAAYLQAYNELNDMLTGKRPASLKRAVFLVENAYYENKIDYAAYNQRIADLATFCRQKLKEEKADTTDQEVKNNMIFRMLTEPLTITDRRTGRKITSRPLHYDFDDFYGREDWTKMFVTKLLNTGFGQCHSMPLLFVTLSQEMGAEAYLSFSPSHCFAKYRSGQTFKNVELTNGHITTDAWVLVSGMVKAEALKSKIYLDTVGRRAQIACMMQDLAAGYIKKFGSDYFAGRCIETGLQYYPNDAYGLAMKANYITAMFQTAVKPYGNTPPGQVLQNPEMKNLYDAMQASYAALDAAGYAEMHPEQYEDWLKSADEEKRKQEHEFFLQYQKTHKTTLQNVTR